VLVLYNLPYYLEVVSSFNDTPPAPSAFSRTDLRHSIRIFMLYNALYFSAFLLHISNSTLAAIKFMSSD
jgi:hypothetical protein